MTPRTGRRGTGRDTRGEILDAARAAFARDGYDVTTIRGVARAAGVDPSLVLHYFGSKATMFGAAMNIPLDPSAVLRRLASGDPAHVGERMVSYFFSLWESPHSRQALLGVVRSAVGSHAAAATLRGFITDAVVARVAAEIGGPNARLRATLVGSQLVGLAMVRYVLRVEPLASADVDTLIGWVAPTVQRYLLGSPDGTRADSDHVPVVC